MKKQTSRTVRLLNNVRYKPNSRLDEVYNKHLQTGIIEDILTKEDYLRYVQLTNERLELGLLYILLKVNGCRFSEVINLTFSDAIFGVAFIVAGTKSSRGRYIFAPGYSEWLSVNENKEGRVFEGLNYCNVRRWFIKYGVFSSVQGKGRLVVTHLPRYQFIDEALRVGRGVDLVRDVVGHKISKTTELYIAKIKRLRNM